MEHITKYRQFIRGVLVSLVMLGGAPVARAHFCPCPFAGGQESKFPNEEFMLGVANKLSVLELGANKVDMTGPAGGVFGDVGIAPNGKFNLTGSQFITGTVFLGAGATFSNSTHAAPGGGVQTNADLSMAISDAINASASLGSIGCEQTFSALNGGEVIDAKHGGLNVICVGDVVVNGGKVVTLSDSGSFGPIFLINVTGRFTLTGGSDILVSGDVEPANVLYNVLGSGQDVALNGGGGGTGCCSAIVEGTLLAVNRKIALSPGLVRGGAVISGRDISIVSGARVTCPPICPAP
jgi:hypothetical protein